MIHLKSSLHNLTLFLFLPLSAWAQTEMKADNERRSVSWTEYAEIAMNHVDKSTHTAEPHLLVGAELPLGQGWSFYGEAEWNGEVDLPQMCIQKRFSEWCTLRAGKLTVPLGMANLYDAPLSHLSTTLPDVEALACHFEGNLPGLSLSGHAASWEYEIQLLTSGDSAALAMRVGCHPLPWISIGMSGYYDGQLVVSTDAEAITNRLTARAIATYHAHLRLLHTGLEAGITLFEQSQSGRLMAFARYDYCNSTPYGQRATLGLNYFPREPLVVKAEVSHSWDKTLGSLALSVGIGIEID